MQEKKDKYASQRKYDAKRYTKIRISLYDVNDMDIVEKLKSVDSRSGYVKHLVREDIAKEKEKTK